MKTIDHISKYLDRLSSGVKKIRFVSLVSGTGLTALGHYWRASEIEWQATNAGTVFWVGLSVLLLTNLLLVFVDRQSVETMKSLHSEELKNDTLNEDLTTLQADNDAVVAWLTLNKLISELVDQAIEAETVDQETCRRLYGAAVEFIAEYKGRLFGIGDDYVNISLYEIDHKLEMLQCVACYRSRPSDMEGPHRSWKIGEGHVGKAFELQNELICADARAPDVAAWIAAPPDKYHEDDIQRYVSLAAIPIAISTTAPIGVAIMTSSEAYRFVNIGEVDSNYPPTLDLQRAKYAVAALQDVVAQIAQLMSILRSKKHNKED